MFRSLRSVDHSAADDYNHSEHEDGPMLTDLITHRQRSSPMIHSSSKRWLTSDSLASISGSSYFLLAVLLVFLLNLATIGYLILHHFQTIPVQPCVCHCRDDTAVAHSTLVSPLTASSSSSLTEQPNREQQLAVASELVSETLMLDISPSSSLAKIPDKFTHVEWTCPILPPPPTPKWCTAAFLNQSIADQLAEREAKYYAGELKSPVQQRPDLTDCEEELFRRFRKERSSTNRQDVIVYLTQKGKHKDYGRDVFSNTMQSLEMLYANYPAATEADVLILTERGAFDDEDRMKMSLNGTRTNMRFFEIAARYWDYVPDCLPNPLPHKWTGGYLRMIRLYAVVLPDLLHHLGYKWMMRMDEESILHDFIPYNFFDNMRSEQRVYGCRLMVDEIEVEFQDHIRRYLQNNKLTEELRLFNLRSEEGCYNNWYITQVDFWRSEQVVQINQYMDATGGTFLYRWNDINTQAAATVFLNRLNEYKVFRDFSYSHLTMRGKFGIYGGLVLGSRNVSFYHDYWPAFDASTRKFLDDYSRRFGVKVEGKCALTPFKRFKYNYCHQ